MPKSLIKLLSLLLILSLSSLWKVEAQDSKSISDLERINAGLDNTAVVVRRSFLFSEKNSPLLKYNPISLILGSALYTYQNLISQQLSADCLYHPSCSEFGKQALEHYGFFKGIMLAADRVNRCNQLSGLDVHPLNINEHTHKADDPVELYKWSD